MSATAEFSQLHHLCTPVAAAICSKQPKPSHMRAAPQCAVTAVAGRPVTAQSHPTLLLKAHNGGWQVSNSGSNIRLWQLASRGMAGLKGGCRSSKWRLAGLTVPDALRTKGRVGALLPCLPYRAARSVQRPMQAGTEAELTVAAGRPHNVRYLPNQRTSRGSPPPPAIQSCKISAAFNASGR